MGRAANRKKKLSRETRMKLHARGVPQTAMVPNACSCRRDRSVSDDVELLEDGRSRCQECGGILICACCGDPLRFRITDKVPMGLIT